jgi:hypothetical protein
VVTESDFYAARKAAGDRRRGPGREKGVPLTPEELAARREAREANEKAGVRRVPNREVRVYPFSGLIFNARDGDPYYVAGGRESGGKPRRMLVNKEAIEGRGTCYSFPLKTFEDAVLSMLQEVDPAELTGNGHKGPDPATVLEGRLELVRAKIKELEAALEEGDVAAVARKLREKEAEERDIRQQLDAVKREAATPLALAWDETKDLLATMAEAPDQEDMRRRLQAALRRVVDSIWLLVLHRGRDSIAMVQVNFRKTPEKRWYWLYHRSPKANQNGRQAGRWWARSVRFPEGLHEIDLRERQHAEVMEKVIVNDFLPLWPGDYDNPEFLAYTRSGVVE